MGTYAYLAGRLARRSFVFHISCILLEEVATAVRPFDHPSLTAPRRVQGRALVPQVVPRSLLFERAVKRIFLLEIPFCAWVKVPTGDEFPAGYVGQWTLPKLTQPKNLCGIIINADISIHADISSCYF